jgi:hypothetical protein
LAIRTTSAAIVALGLSAFGCGGADEADVADRPPDPLRPCVRTWNRPANFAQGHPGSIVRRLRPRPAVPLFAHVSVDKQRRCVVFLDTPSTVDDRRFVRRRDEYFLDCAGDCGQDVPPGARTAQFLRDGTLPAL